MPDEIAKASKPVSQPSIDKEQTTVTEIRVALARKSLCYFQVACHCCSGRRRRHQHHYYVFLFNFRTRWLDGERDPLWSPMLHLTSNNAFSLNRQCTYKLGFYVYSRQSPINHQASPFLQHVDSPNSCNFQLELTYSDSLKSWGMQKCIMWAKPDTSLAQISAGTTIIRR